MPSANTLSIQIYLDGLSFCVGGEEQKSVLLNQEDYKAQITQYLESKKSKFSSFEFIVCSSLLVTIPAELYDSEVGDKYLLSRVETLSDLAIFHSEVAQIKILFAIPSKIDSILSKYFEQRDYTHQIKNLLESCGDFSEDAIFIYSSKSTTSIVAVQNSRLIFCNTLPYLQKEDIAYYIVQLMNDYQCDELKLKASGQHSNFLLETIEK